MPLWNRHESPQIRRLKNDHAAMERLLTESSILQFKTSGSIPTRYLVEFSGRTLGREKGRISVRTTQRVEISLGASYPRSMPEIRWITPVFHPNISEIGTVCLGGYGTHWVPSLHLDDLCGMLWDMARYYNYDVRSPYNREAALWCATQTGYTYPIDGRPLRDLRAAAGRLDGDSSRSLPPSSATLLGPAPIQPTLKSQSVPGPDDILVIGD